MSRFLLRCLIAIVAVGYIQPVVAQGNEIIRETVRARSASGMVYGGRLDRKDGLNGVSVLQCNAEFSHCSEVAKTDANGRYVLARAAVRGKTVYLKYVSLGFDEVELTVRLSVWARKLEVRLVPGT